VATASAFAPQPKSFVSQPLAATLPGAEVDPLGNNMKVKALLEKVEQTKLLSKVAEAGLLSKAQDAGISLSKLEPLLALAAENKDVLILVEASGPELLPFLPKLVELAPPVLPLLAAAISIPPSAIATAGAASVAAAGAAVYFIPDDSIASVAAQTLAVGVLGIAAPAAAAAGSFVLGSLQK